MSIICSLSDTLLFKQIANKAIEMKNKEINEAVEKLKMAELKKQEWEQNSRKLEEDVPRLRQALEQSITRLNRMSSDSDFYVDRSEPTLSQLCTLVLQVITVSLSFNINCSTFYAHLMGQVRLLQTVQEVCTLDSFML